MYREKRLKPIEEAGLKVFVGSEYNIRIAETENSVEIRDFTKEGTTRLIFPTSFSIKQEREVIEQARIGLPTSLKFLGKTQITGDIGDVVTPNGVAFYTAFTLSGVVKSLKNDNAFISIEYDGNFIVDITKDVTGKTTQVDFILSETERESITIIEGMTVMDFVSALNAITNTDGNSKFLALLHIGEGSEIFAFEDGGNEATTSINGSIREFFRVGALSDTYRKSVAPYISFVVPRRGDARFFNLLVSSNHAPMSTQYVGARFLSLNMSYQNNNLTTATTNVWASYAYDFEGVPTQAEVDDMSAVYAQTNGYTKAYTCLQRATTISSIINNFVWTLEPNYNITNEAYEIPVVKYSDSYDFEMMFNEQSQDIFEKRVNDGKNISIMLDTQTMKNGKMYNIIKSSKTLLGQPQYPEIADGVIGLTASGFTAVASVYDPYTSLTIITSDSQLDITYTEDEIKSDFSSYVNS